MCLARARPSHPSTEVWTLLQTHGQTPHRKYKLIILVKLVGGCTIKLIFLYLAKGRSDDGRIKT